MSALSLAGQLSGAQMRVYARGRLGCPSTFENFVSRGTIDDQILNNVVAENLKRDTKCEVS
jgi:hypothetical protein